jgi:hypothetical protein
LHVLCTLPDLAPAALCMILMMLGSRGFEVIVLPGLVRYHIYSCFCCFCLLMCAITSGCS